MNIILKYLFGTKIDRYFYKELIFSIVLVYVGVLSIFVMLDYANNTDYFDSALRDRMKIYDRQQAELGNPEKTTEISATQEKVEKPTYFNLVATHYMCQIPFLFYLLTPVVITIAISFTILRMSKNNEFLILKTSGISIRKILRPAMMISLLFTVALLVFNEWGLPVFVENVHVNQASRQRKKRLKSQVFTDPKGMILYIGSYENRMQTGEYIYAIEYTEKVNPPTDLANPDKLAPKIMLPNQSLSKIKTQNLENGLPVITEAESITYDFKRGWVLGKGLIRRFVNVSADGLNFHKVELVEEFEAGEKVLDFDVLPGYIGKRSLMLLEELSISEIFKLILDKPQWVAPRVQLQRHLAFPFAPILLFMLTISILLNSQNKNILLGVGLSILFSFGFYGTVIIASGAAIQGDLPPNFAISFAVIPFVVGAIFMYSRVRS